MKEEIILICMTGVGADARRVRIVKGHEYIISPIDPKNIKNRDRHVIALGAALNKPGHENGDYGCRVRFNDNNGIGKVEFGALVPVNPEDLLPIV